MAKSALLITCLVLCNLIGYSQTAVFFHVANQRTTTHSEMGYCMAFDITMQASIAGTYHSRGQVYIAYNPGKFGVDVVENGKIAIEPGPLVNETFNFFGTNVEKYATVNLIDNAANIFAVTWQSNFLNSFPHPMLHTTVEDTAITLYTVYLAIQNNSAPPHIDIFRRLMRNQTWMLSNQDADNDGLPDEVQYANGFLPVEYMGFDYELQRDHTVSLNWITSKEINNKLFVIEKDQGDGEFEAIGEVAGAGDTDRPQYYEFTDYTPLTENNFYRIKQVDLDGTSTYSHVIEVAFEGGNSFQISPTLTQESCTLQATGELPSSSYGVYILDVMGNILLEKTLNPANNQGKLNFDFSSFNTGMYFVQVFTQEGPLYAAKVLKVQP